MGRRNGWGGESCGVENIAVEAVRQVWCGARRRGETGGGGVQVEEIGERVVRVQSCGSRVCEESCGGRCAFVVWV